MNKGSMISNFLSTIFHYPSSISFASPESDCTGPIALDIADPLPATNVSFATPYSDMVAPSTQEILAPHSPVPATNVSFASPYSDTVAPSADEVFATVTPYETTLSFASPELDFCAPTPETLNLVSAWRSANSPAPFAVAHSALAVRRSVCLSRLGAGRERPVDLPVLQRC